MANKLITPKELKKYIRKSLKKYGLLGVIVHVRDISFWNQILRRKRWTIT